MNKISVLIAISVILAASAMAGAESAPLEIGEALSITLENNASLRSLREELKKAEAFKLQAEGALLPSVSVNGALGWQREPQTESGDRDDDRSAQATAEQELYTGGRVGAMRAQSPQVKTIAEMAVAESENAAAGELFARFYNVLLQKKCIEAEEDAVKTSELHLREVSRMCDVGAANRLEVIRASRQLAENNAALATARGAFETANISLMNYMGIEPSARRAVNGELYEPLIEGGREKSLALAQRFRADRRRLEEQLGYQENQIKIERSESLPRLSAGLSAGWLSPYRSRDESGDTWRAEVRLSIPIFDRGITRRAVMEAKAVREQDKIALEQKELDIKSEVETAWTEIETNREHLAASREALNLARESLRLAEAGYREGVTPQLDLLTAQSELTSAQLEYNRAQYNCIIAAVALKMTEGTITEWNGESI